MSSRLARHPPTIAPTHWSARASHRRCHLCLPHLRSCPTTPKSCFQFPHHLGEILSNSLVLLYALSSNLPFASMDSKFHSTCAVSGFIFSNSGGPLSPPRFTAVGESLPFSTSPFPSLHDVLPHAPFPFTRVPPQRLTAMNRACAVVSLSPPANSVDPSTPHLCHRIRHRILSVLHPSSSVVTPSTGDLLEPKRDHHTGATSLPRHTHMEATLCHVSAHPCHFLPRVATLW